MANKPIELFGMLRKFKPPSKNGRSRDRMTIEFRAPEVYFDGDEKKVAQSVAVTLSEVIKANLSAGLDMAGKPLPAASPATIERREYRAKQAARGGAADDRYDQRTKFARGVKRNFTKRFRTAKMGTFGPDSSVGGGKLFGYESGMLARSVKVVAESSGSFRLFFGIKVLVIDNSGNPVEGATVRIYDAKKPEYGFAKMQTGVKMTDGKNEKYFNFEDKEAFNYSGKAFPANLMSSSIQQVKQQLIGKAIAVYNWELHKGKEGKFSMTSTSFTYFKLVDPTGFENGISESDQIEELFEEVPIQEIEEGI
jgi:hypothetical protein